MLKTDRKQIFSGIDNTFLGDVSIDDATYPQVTIHCVDSTEKPYYERNPLTALTYVSDLEGNILVDFIGRLEHIEEDVNKLNRYLLKKKYSYLNDFELQNVISNEKIEPLHRNNRKLGDNYREFYDDESREYISKVCEWEIKEFGYKF